MVTQAATEAQLLTLLLPRVNYLNYHKVFENLQHFLKNPLAWSLETRPRQPLLL